MKVLYAVLLNGNLRFTDRGVRTYKTFERAEKENERYLRNGYTVEICEYKLVNTTEVKQASE